MLPIDEYEKLRREPMSPHVMYQRWRSLLFIHYSFEPEVVQRMLPPELDVDTFDGRAWVGLVPFRMEGVRSRFSPISLSFPETNVRTYVHKNGKNPGVWFFSLDASNKLACNTARTFWSLPYRHSEMGVDEVGQVRSYNCQRHGSGIQSSIEARIGDPVGHASPGSLEYFLIERYLLYAAKAGVLVSGQVHHCPYPLQRAQVSSCSDGLVRATGFEADQVEHVVYSPGVDVKIYPIKPV